MDRKQGNAHPRRIKRLGKAAKPAPNKSNTESLQFVARVISLPLAQETLSATQSFASQSRLGRVLLDQTHTLIQRTMHHTQTSPTYQTYIQHNQRLQRTLVVMDGWACGFLDRFETAVPLIQQPTATIVDTLIVRPRQRIVDVMSWPWISVEQEESALTRVVQVGKEQATRVWSHRPLLAQNRLTHSILSRLGATLSN